MTKFPLVEAMGLKIKNVVATNEATYPGYSGWEAIRAEDLEKALQDAQVAYGNPMINVWGPTSKTDTHQARVICIQPIKKKTKSEAALEFIETLSKLDNVGLCLNESLIIQSKEILEMEE